jgi:mRNA interferase HigB
MPNRGDSEDPLKAWFAEAEEAAWRTPAQIKAKYGNASFVGDNRVVFNIAGNKYRLIAHVSYEKQTLMIKFIGTHSEYDQITAKTVGGGKK